MLLATVLWLMAVSAPEGVVPARDIEKGEIVTADDLAPGPATSLPATAVVGREAARRLAAGADLKSYDLLRPQLVRRGMPVTLVVREGAMTITSAGRALSGGSAGETVRVVSTVTNRSLEGLVDGSGKVRIPGN